MSEFYTGQASRIPLAVQVVHRNMAKMHVFAFDVEMTFISGGNTWYNA